MIKAPIMTAKKMRFSEKNGVILKQNCTNESQSDCMDHNFKMDVINLNISPKNQLINLLKK